MKLQDLLNKFKGWTLDLTDELDEGDKCYYIPNCEGIEAIVVRLSEGDGSNLVEEDYENGNDSYVNFELETMGEGSVDQRYCWSSPYRYSDGGIEMYNSEEETFDEHCEAVMKEWFGDDARRAIPLEF